MITRFKVAALCSVLALTAFQAKADLVYDNGPINGTITGYTINNGFSVSNSFTVTGATNLTSGELGLWVSQGATPSSVNWSIGTTVYGAEISSGTASLTNTYWGNAYGIYDIYTSAFSLSGSLASGTYYLTLNNATASDSGYVFWDQNNGPSTAHQLYPNNSQNVQLDNSQSFRLFGDGRNVPDSGTSIALLGCAVAGLGFIRRRLASS